MTTLPWCQHPATLSTLAEAGIVCGKPLPCEIHAAVDPSREAEMRNSSQKVQLPTAILDVEQLQADVDRLAGTDDPPF